MSSTAQRKKAREHNFVRAFLRVANTQGKILDEDREALTETNFVLPHLRGR
jgi:hypothetical protein